MASLLGTWADTAHCSARPDLLQVDNAVRLRRKFALSIHWFALQANLVVGESSNCIKVQSSLFKLYASDAACCPLRRTSSWMGIADGLRGMLTLVS